MIIDSSSLIIFAKINKLDILIALLKEIFITKKIYTEIVEDGLLHNASDAKILKHYVDSGKVKIKSLNVKYEEFSANLMEIYSFLGTGESDAISLAIQEKDKTLVMDESLGRNVAKLYNLKSLGSLRILLEAFQKNIINETEIKKIVDLMIKNKFRLGAEVLSEFWDAFSKLKNKR